MTSYTKNLTTTGSIVCIYMYVERETEADGVMQDFYLLPQIVLPSPTSHMRTDIITKPQISSSPFVGFESR